MKKIIYILLILPFLYQCTTKKDEPVYEGYASLELRLKGKKYDTLTAHARYKPDSNKSPENIKVLEIKGSSDDGYNWTFLLPDSLRKYGVSCYIHWKPFYSEKNEGYIITFSSKELYHRMSMLSVPLEEKETILEGTYIKSEEKGLNYSWKFNLPDGIVDSPTIQTDLFYIEIKEKDRYTNWEVEFRYPEYGLMPEDEQEYEKTMEEYIQLAKKYPNSILLASRIGPGMGFRSKKDMKRVLNTFSDETQKEYWEEYPYYKEYFSESDKHVDINNLKLINSQTGELEPVIMDKSKPTLVIFSCIGWERNESNSVSIPFIKEIYEEKASNLDIAFINIDTENIDKWKTLIEEENIPWRSFLANKEENQALFDTYQYWGISSGILIEKGEAKVLFLRNKNRLKEIINNY